MADNVIQLKNALSLHIEKLVFYDENGNLLDDSAQKKYADLLTSIFFGADSFGNTQDDYADLEKIFSHDGYKLKVKTALAPNAKGINEFLSSIKGKNALINFETNPRVRIDDFSCIDFSIFDLPMITLQCSDAIMKYRITVFYN